MIFGLFMGIAIVWACAYKLHHGAWLFLIVPLVSGLEAILDTIQIEFQDEGQWAFGTAMILTILHAIVAILVRWHRNRQLKKSAAQ